MSITSSKISFGTQFKAHIVANRAARHLRLKKLEKRQKKEKDVQGILTSTIGVIYLVLRGFVTSNDGAVTYYAQYGRTMHARAAAEARKHGARAVDCNSRRAVYTAVSG
jgi:hypothetical protein